MSLIFSEPFGSPYQALTRLWSLEDQQAFDYREVQTAYNTLLDNVSEHPAARYLPCTLEVHRWISDTFRTTSYRLKFEQPWKGNKRDMACSIAISLE